MQNLNFELQRALDDACNKLYTAAIIAGWNNRRDVAQIIYDAISKIHLAIVQQEVHNG